MTQQGHTIIAGEVAATSTDPQCWGRARQMLCHLPKKKPNQKTKPQTKKKPKQKTNHKREDLRNYKLANLTPVPGKIMEQTPVEAISRHTEEQEGPYKQPA